MTMIVTRVAMFDVQEVPPGLQSLSFASIPGPTASPLTDCGSSGSSCKLLQASLVCHPWTAPLQLQLATCLRDPHLVAPVSAPGTAIACQQQRYESLPVRNPDGGTGVTSVHTHALRSTSVPHEPTPFTSPANSTDTGSVSSPVALLAVAEVEVPAISVSAPVDSDSCHLVISSTISESDLQLPLSCSQQRPDGETAPNHPPAPAMATENAGAASDARALSDAADRLLAVLSEAVRVRCISLPASSAATTGGSNEMPDMQQARLTNNCSPASASRSDTASALPQTHLTALAPQCSASAPEDLDTNAFISDSAAAVSSHYWSCPHCRTPALHRRPL